MSVIAAAEDTDGDRPFGVLINNYLAAQERGEPVGQPPLEQTVYLESLSDNGMTIAAGNRAKTMWRFQLALTGANPVSGSFGAIEVNSEGWPGNVWNFNTALRRAVRGVSGKTGKWPGQF
jgi:hypothetical protein